MGVTKAFHKLLEIFHIEKVPLISQKVAQIWVSQQTIKSWKVAHDQKLLEKLMYAKICKLLYKSKISKHFLDLLEVDLLASGASLFWRRLSTFVQFCDETSVTKQALSSIKTKNLIS